MPFTFAHPAYAFPLKYASPKYLSLTGLILGSMGPDFEYFIYLEPHQKIGHTFLGLFIEVIPLSILLAVIFHYVVKEALALHLPSRFNLNQRAYNRRSKWRLDKLSVWVIFLMSVTIGFISHITTDAFTHEHGFFVFHFSFLKEVIWFKYPIYKILQHSLSAIGLFVILNFITYYLYRSSSNVTDMPKIRTNQKLLFWSFALLITAAITVMKLLTTSSTNILGILVVAPISGLCLGLIVSSFIWRIRRV